MFGHGRYLQMKARADKLPQVEVTREEFIRLMMETGKSRKDAEFQATIAAGLGAHTMIGDKMVGIKESPCETQDNTLSDTSESK
jgi:hypothetical protein